MLFSQFLGSNNDLFRAVFRLLVTLLTFTGLGAMVSISGTNTFSWFILEWLLSLAFCKDIELRSTFCIVFWVRVP